MTTNHPTFGKCIKKWNARKDTIIDVYREHFGECLPADKQYWTMCASHVDYNGEFLEHSELGQLLDSGLITKEQFYGVDIDSDVIESNAAGVPDVNWIHSDFSMAMRYYHKVGNFNPGVINADFVSMEKKSAQIASKIMHFVSHIDVRNVLLICNIMEKNPRNSGIIAANHEPDFERLSNVFLNNDRFRYSISLGGWSCHDYIYWYRGTGRNSKTVMVTYCFVRK